MEPTKEPKKRGPKIKPADQRHTLAAYKHAPDVTALLATVPKGKRSRLVDEAIRLFFKQGNK
jgi:hypothetical protein